MPLPPEFFRDFQQDPQKTGSGLGLPEPPKFAPGEAKGCFIGAIMRIMVPASFVTPLLPQGVIMPVEAAEPGYLHGVNLAFGFQRDVHPDGLDWLPGCNYMEFVLGVPNVYLSQPVNGFRGPCAVLTRLELNQLLPVILGRTLGLPKRLARVETTEYSFRILSFLGNQLFIEGSFEPYGDVVAPASLDGFNDIISTFSQPGVSHVPGLGLVFSQYRWFWDLGVGQLTNGNISIDEGWGGGDYGRRGNVGHNCPGAWRVHVPWTMQAFTKPQPQPQAAGTTAA
jgi:hypothetical protein